MNLTVDAIRRRLAAGAPVQIQPLSDKDIDGVRDMLSIYIETLENNNQPEAVQHLYSLLGRPQDYFVKVAPTKQ